MLNRLIVKSNDDEHVDCDVTNTYYNRLLKFCEDNNVTLKYDYSDEKLHQCYKIEGTCKIDGCNNCFIVTLKHLLKKNGGRCKDCMSKYNYPNLKKLCDDDNIILTKDYKDIKLSSKTDIEGYCNGNGCTLTFKKRFERLMIKGAYCRACAGVKNKYDEDDNEIIDDEHVDNNVTNIYHNKLRIYCEDNNITLKYDYSNENLHPLYKIEGTCKIDGCDNPFNVTLKHLLTTNKGRCHDCISKYNYPNLKKYCNDANIVLTKDYKDTKLSSTSRIEGECKNTSCESIFDKSYKIFLRTGPYCNTCSIIRGREKTMAIVGNNKSLDKTVETTENEDNYDNESADEDNNESVVDEKTMTDNSKKNLIRLNEVAVHQSKDIVLVMAVHRLSKSVLNTS